MNCFPRDQSLSDLLYSTKRKTRNGNSNDSRPSTLETLSTRTGDDEEDLKSAPRLRRVRRRAMLVSSL